MATLPIILELADALQEASPVGCCLVRLARHTAPLGSAGIANQRPRHTCMGPGLKPEAGLAGVRGPVAVALPPAWPQGSAAAMERVTEAGTTCGPELGLQPEGACTYITSMLEQLARTASLHSQAAWGCQA